MPAFLRVSEPGVIFAAWLVVVIRQRGLGVSSTGPFYLGLHADTMPPDLRSTNALRSLTRTAVQRGPIFTNGGKSGSFFAQSQNVDKDIPRVFCCILRAFQFVFHLLHPLLFKESEASVRRYSIGLGADHLQKTCLLKLKLRVPQYSL